MKIVISANSAWNIFNFRLDLIKSLIKSNFKIILLTPYEEKYCKILIHLGCEHHHILIDRKSLSPLNNIFLIFQYIKIIKKLNPDFFLGFTIKPNICGSIAANFNGVPVINTYLV